MAIQQREGTGYCQVCQKQVLTHREHKRPNHILHLLITVLMCGLWFPVWIILTLLHLLPFSSPRCSNCGTPITFSDERSFERHVRSRKQIGEQVINNVDREILEAQTHLDTMIDRSQEIPLERADLVEEWNRYMLEIEKAKEADDKKSVRVLTKKEQALWQQVESLDSERKKIKVEIPKVEARLNTLIDRREKMGHGFVKLPGIQNRK